MKTCVVNFATNSKWYPDGQRRLLQSLKDVGFDGTVFSWLGEGSLGCRSHSDAPYTYKTYALCEARDQGFDQALWLDCSMWAVANLKPVFAKLQEQGHLFVDANWKTGQWSTDEALDVMECTRDEAMEMPMLSSGFVGLDFSHDHANKFLDEWHFYSSNTNIFRGPWDNKDCLCSSDPRVLGHRHDQTVASVLAHRLGMTLEPEDSYFCYGGKYADEPRAGVYVLARGM